MAEALGIASGAAGLVGLSGQILQGCLFAKSFFEDAKDPPKVIEQILKELETLQAIAEKTKLMFEEVEGSHAIINEQYFQPPLTQCFDIMTRLGKKLAEISRKIEMKKSTRRWELMKAAARTKVINGQLVCLERAKSSLLVVQQNITIALQQQNQSNLKETNRAVHSIQATTSGTALKVDQVLAQESDAMAVAKQTDQNVVAISTGLQEIRSQIGSQILTMATADMADRISTQNNAILAATGDIRSQMATAEMANQISIQGSAILATGQETCALASSTSTDVQHTLSELRNLRSFLGLCEGHQGQSPETLQSLVKSALSEALTEHRSSLISNERSDIPLRTFDENSSPSPLASTNEKQIRRRSRVTTRTTYNTGLFKVRVKTVEHLFDVVHTNSKAPRPERRLATTYEIVPNTLFLRRGFFLEYIHNLAVSAYNYKPSILCLMIHQSFGRVGLLMSTKFGDCSIADLRLLRIEIPTGNLF